MNTLLSHKKRKEPPIYIQQDKFTQHVKTFHGSVTQWDKALQTTSQCGNEGHALKGFGRSRELVVLLLGYSYRHALQTYTMGVVALQEWEPALHSATSEWGR